MNINQPVILATTSQTLIAETLQMRQSSEDCATRSSPAILLFTLMLLLTLFGLVTPSVHAASFNSSLHESTSPRTGLVTSLVSPVKLLFRSNLGSGVSLSALYNFSTNGAWQSINGTDKDTGYTWPVAALNSNFSGVQLITVDPINPSTIGKYITNEFRSVAGPKGNPVNELAQFVKIKAPAGQGGSQAPFLINRPWTKGDVNDLYITYWFKYQADLATQLTNAPSSGNWRTQFEFKTGGYNNSWPGDYRIGTSVIKGWDGTLYWSTKGDNFANGPGSPTTYWTEDNHVVPVPVDKWFKFEVFWHRSSGSDGRYWAAVNGEVIVDHHGPNMGDYNLPITRIMVSNPYSGGYATVENHTTGLEIWNGFPCGVGVSCYNYDTAAPSVPTSFVAKLAKYTSSATVTLTWAASSDDVGVAGYNIYKNGTKIGVSTSASFTDTFRVVSTGTLYNYTVKAFDASDNLSDASSVASVVY